jgi:hypothetical protein
MDRPLSCHRCLGILAKIGGLRQIEFGEFTN